HPAWLIGPSKVTGTATKGSALSGLLRIGGGDTIARTGRLTASPTTMASPVRSIGNIFIRSARLSLATLLTALRSTELVKRIANTVPHCERMVESISEGRCVTIIIDIPYFRPSFAIRLIAIAADAPCK